MSPEFLGAPAIPAVDAVASAGAVLAGASLPALAGLALAPVAALRSTWSP